MCKRTLIKNWGEGGGGRRSSKAEINIKKYQDFDCLKEVDEKRHFLAAHSGEGGYINYSSFTLHEISLLDRNRHARANQLISSPGVPWWIHIIFKYRLAQHFGKLMALIFFSKKKSKVRATAVNRHWCITDRSLLVQRQNAKTDMLQYSYSALVQRLINNQCGHTYLQMAGKETRQMSRIRCFTYGRTFLLAVSSLWGMKHLTGLMAVIRVHRDLNNLINRGYVIYYKAFT